MIQCSISFHSEISFKRVEQKPIHGLIEKEFCLGSFFGLFQLHMIPVHELLRYSCEGITRTVGGSSQRGLLASQNVDIFRIGTSGYTHSSKSANHVFIGILSLGGPISQCLPDRPLEISCFDKSVHKLDTTIRINGHLMDKAYVNHRKRNQHEA